MADIHCYFVSSKDDHYGRNVAMSLVLAKQNRGQDRPKEPEMIALDWVYMQAIWTFLATCTIFPLHPFTSCCYL